jgi:hypothetical protein
MQIIKQVFIAGVLFICLKPYLLKSQINWTNHFENPVIGGDFDPEALSIHRQSVLFDGHYYHMWYSSARVFPVEDTQLQLSCMGYATSPDGVSWHSENPVVIGPAFVGNAFDMLHMPGRDGSSQTTTRLKYGTHRRIQILSIKLFQIIILMSDNRIILPVRKPLY